MKLKISIVKKEKVDSICIAMVDENGIPIMGIGCVEEEIEIEEIPEELFNQRLNQIRNVPRLDKTMGDY